ncbi:MAG: type I 3-dehydroquinate dehydratase [Planctomycetota bacterium]
MTRLCVPIFVHDFEQALADARRAQAGGADLIELRIDQFTDEPAAVVELVDACPLPCIVTCRPIWEGGVYDGDEQTRVALLEHIGLHATTGPVYFDFELAAYDRSANLRQKINLVADRDDRPRKSTAALILSSHDFEGRPPDLLRRVAAMNQHEQCKVVKLAWLARSLRDNLEAFELIADRVKPTIALCMGEYGLASRVLAKKFGALLTFAALGDGEGTAPGQPTLDNLKGLFHWDTINDSTTVYGVVGHPVGHSMSPAIHNAGFGAVGFNGVYLPMPIPPEYEHFKATIGSWLDDPRLGFQGASVTIPHKQNLLRFVRERGGEVEPLAERIGVANTLHRRDDGTLYAGNTDYAAALDAVCDALGIERSGLAGKRVGVLGAGGAARAAVAGYTQYNAGVTVYNRTIDKAKVLAQAFGADHAALADARTAQFDILINCTPIGMHPNVDASPVDLPGTPADAPGPRVVFDTIYNPVRTRLLERAEQLGDLTVSGTEMFVRQAAAQFELWTGQAAPLVAFREVLLDRLGA